jgi:hypothetical protein
MSPADEHEHTHAHESHEDSGKEHDHDGPDQPVTPRVLIFYDYA